jgi:hypothetical protein
LAINRRDAQGGSMEPERLPAHVSSFPPLKEEERPLGIRIATGPLDRGWLSIAPTRIFVSQAWCISLKSALT